MEELVEGTDEWITRDITSDYIKPFYLLRHYAIKAYEESHDKDIVTRDKAWKLRGVAVNAYFDACSVWEGRT